nr:TBCC domain-containing protein 1-like [Ipomoea batatas]
MKKNKGKEQFEHGLLPIPKLIFTDGMQTLAPIKDKLLLLCADSAHRVNSQSISETLQISPGHTRLVLKTVATSYKRPLPKGHKDSAAVADVWPSTSAFDGFLSALSPLQLGTEYGDDGEPLRPRTVGSEKARYTNRELRAIKSVYQRRCARNDEEDTLIFVDFFSVAKTIEVEIVHKIDQADDGNMNDIEIVA